VLLLFLRLLVYIGRHVLGGIGEPLYSIEVALRIEARSAGQRSEGPNRTWSLTLGLNREV